MRGFSQEELASKAKITRSALRNYEGAARRMPFNTGLAICRALDLSPLWVAIGEGEERGFVEPEQLGIPKAQLQGLNRRNDFLTVIQDIVAEPYRKQRRKIQKSWVGKQIEGGPETMAQNASDEELKSQLLMNTAELVCAKDERDMLWRWELVAAFHGEVGRRLAKRNEIAEQRMNKSREGKR